MSSLNLSKPDIVHTERRLIAVAPVKARMDALPQAQKSARTKLDAALKTLDVGPLGEYLTLWRPPRDGAMDLRPGRLVSKPFVPVGDVGPSELPPGRAGHLKADTGVGALRIELEALTLGGGKVRNISADLGGVSSPVIELATDIGDLTLRSLSTFAVEPQP